MFDKRKLECTAFDHWFERTLAASLIVWETVSGGTAAEKGTDGVAAVVLTPSVVHWTLVDVWNGKINIRRQAMSPHSGGHLSSFYEGT